MKQRKLIFIGIGILFSLMFVGLVSANLGIPNSGTNVQGNFKFISRGLMSATYNLSWQVLGDSNSIPCDAYFGYPYFLVVKGTIDDNEIPNQIIGSLTPQEINSRGGNSTLNYPTGSSSNINIEGLKAYYEPCTSEPDKGNIQSTFQSSGINCLLQGHQITCFIEGKLYGEKDGQMVPSAFYGNFNGNVKIKFYRGFNWGYGILILMFLVLVILFFIFKHKESKHSRKRK